jgi:hypothetical protein
MSNAPFFQQHLTEAEVALVNRRHQRAALDLEIETLEKVIQLYREAIYRADDVPPPERGETPVHRYGSKRDRIRRGIKQLLTDRGTCHRSEIAEHLKSLGVVGSEKDSLAAVSSILSASGEFVTDHNGNWSLAPTERKDADMTT